MIRSLKVQNYSLIQSLELRPVHDLNIIMGETGAGKSIIVGAVGLLTGNRVDSGVLFFQDKKCLVEGVFDVTAYGMEKAFQEHDLDYDHECIIRREILPGGKSRAFVNDTPVTLQCLKELTMPLIDIHSQYLALQLSSGAYQLRLIDAYGNNSKLLRRYGKEYRRLRDLQRALEDVENSGRLSDKDLEYRQHLLEELLVLSLEEIDLEEIEGRVRTLDNADQIREALTRIDRGLDGPDSSILPVLTRILAESKVLEGTAQHCDDIRKRLHSSREELKDLLPEVHEAIRRMDSGALEAQTLRDRLDTINGLLFKHRVRGIQQLIIIRETLEKEIEGHGDACKKAEQTTKALQDCEEKVHALGSELGGQRRAQAEELGARLEKVIGNLGIKDGRIRIEMSSLPPTSSGMDQANILFSANKGVAPRPIGDVASGGEYSRLIFALKYLVADKMSLPTLVLDEIDTGISGEAAVRLVRMMQEMSRSHQILAISHLPQIVAGASKHYLVYKTSDGQQSVSKIKSLHAHERVESIARMLGGNAPSEKAIANARDLVDTYGPQVGTTL